MKCSTLTRQTAERLWFWATLTQARGDGNEAVDHLLQTLTAMLWNEDSTPAREHGDESRTLALEASIPVAS